MADSPGTQHAAEFHFMHSEEMVLPESKPIPVEIVNSPEFQQSRSQSHFSCDTFILTAGQTTLIPANPYRKRVVIYGDSANASDVFIASRETFLAGGSAPFVKGIKLPAVTAGNTPLTLEFTHQAEIALFCSAAATVYAYEERYSRSDS